MTSGNSIKFPECQDPCANVNLPVENFLATDGSGLDLTSFRTTVYVALDSQQSEKVTNTRIVNLAVATIWVRLT